MQGLEFGRVTLAPISICYLRDKLWNLGAGGKAALHPMKEPLPILLLLRAIPLLDEKKFFSD